MIFVTVGSHTPFDRMIMVVDAWAAARQRDDVFAQIGDSAYLPRHMKYVRTLAPRDFELAVIEAEFIVSHAGTGTILTAAMQQKRIVVFPRHASLGETRSEHQIPTAERFAERGFVTAAYTPEELDHAMDRATDLSAPPPINAAASTRLIACIRTCIQTSARGLRS